MCHHAFLKTLGTFSQNLNHHSSFNAVAYFYRASWSPLKIRLTSNFIGQEIKSKVVAMVCSLIGIAIKKRKQEFAHPKVCVGPISLRLRGSFVWCYQVQAFAWR